MRVFGLTFVVACFAHPMLLSAAEPSGKEGTVYEMRTYWSPEGKLDALHARFREHTLKLFEKHGMTNVGYWVPLDNKENKLIYILFYPSKEAREQAWKAFRADPDWIAVYKRTQANGTLVIKLEELFLKTTDYSPPVKASQAKERVFELRTYTATPGNLDHLNARFRDHTLKLFEKHGMTNFGYWTPLAGQKGADNMLIYLLAHKSVDAAKTSFSAFGKDADWIAARKASEAKAGGSLTAKGGVQSLFLKATDYSPTR